MAYIELWAFLKLHNVVSSGGQAKELIRSGAIRVNGETETRVRKKLIAGDIVGYQDNKFSVKEEETKMEKA